MVQSDNTTEPWLVPWRVRAGDADAVAELPLGHLSWGAGTCHYCRGAWARVTIDPFRHWALQTF